MEMEKPLELLGALVVFFITYLYLPHVIFKRGVEFYADLGRRRDMSDLEEFLGSALPSCLLVVLTHVFNQTVVHADHLLIPPPCHYKAAVRILPDWQAVAAFVSGHSDEVTRYISTPWRRGGEARFVVRLVLVSLLLGMITGNAARRQLRQPVLKKRAPVLPPVALRRWWTLPLHVWRMTFFVVVELVSLPVFIFWYTAAGYESLNPLFVWSVQQPYLFVRTEAGSRLYFGQFHRYEKSATGEIDTIVLKEVQRYCYDEIDTCMIEGRSPLRPLGGELTLKWAMIADVDTLDGSKHLHDIDRRYKLLRIERLAAALRASFAGRRFLTVPDVYRLHGGTTKFELGDYRAAIAWLVTRGLVQLSPDVDVVTVPIADTVSVAFADFVGTVPAATSC